MQNDPLSSINTRQTPQGVQAREDQVQNTAGGYVFEIDDRARALRFLILGTEGGTYYTSQQELTEQNAKTILKLANTDGEWLVETIVDVSEGGRAPRQNPTLFALAAACASSDPAARQAALKAIPRVCRIGTHLFIFARYVEQFRGWGRGLRSAVGDWYLNKPVESVAFQAIKYRQREGWSHRDLLRLSHPKTDEPERRALFDWITHDVYTGYTPLQVIAHGKALAETTPTAWASLVERNHLPWEALPDAALNEPIVWESMLPSMGITALIRNLPRLSRLGIITPLGGQTKLIVDRLTDTAALTKGRVHPLSIITALYTYRSGHGMRGSGTWTPVAPIIDALDEAFYLAFGAVTPSGKNTLLALDVSGSMQSGSVAGSPLTPMDATAVMAMVTVRTEANYHTVGFSSGAAGEWMTTGRSRHSSHGWGSAITEIPLSSKMRLDAVVDRMQQVPMGGTDCALPFLYAEAKGLDVDTFVVYTDNETWAGDIQPFQALERYRQHSGKAARSVVVGMTATEFSIADPNDAGMLDVVGFDVSAPDLISSFSRGEI